MDFSGVTNDTSSQVSEAIEYILSIDVPPSYKQARIADVLEQIGSYYHDQLYGATSQVFDSATIASVGLDDASDRAQRLANKIMRNYALGRDTLTALVKEYYNTILGKAQYEAFSNALSMQKHPTLTRMAFRGRPDCEWCKKKAGTYTNPTSKDFGRHDRCDCLFIVSGYNSRNGLLSNYIKKG